MEPSKNRAQRLLYYLSDVLVNGPSTPFSTNIPPGALRLDILILVPVSYFLDIRYKSSLSLNILYLISLTSKNICSCMLNLSSGHLPLSTQSWILSLLLVCVYLLIFVVTSILISPLQPKSFPLFLSSPVALLRLRRLRLSCRKKRISATTPAHFRRHPKAWETSSRSKVPRDSPRPSALVLISSSPTPHSVTLINLCSPPGSERKWWVSRLRFLCFRSGSFAFRIIKWLFRHVHVMVVLKWFVTQVWIVTLCY